MQTYELEASDKAHELRRKLTCFTIVEMACGCEARVQGEHFGETQKLANRVRSEKCEECEEEGI